MTEQHEHHTVPADKHAQLEQAHAQLLQKHEDLAKAHEALTLSHQELHNRVTTLEAHVHQLTTKANGHH